MNNADNIVQYISVPSYILPIPAIIMLCVSSRIIVFIIINIVMMWFVAKLGKRIALGEDYKSPPPLPPQRRPEFEYNQQFPTTGVQTTEHSQVGVD